MRLIFVLLISNIILVYRSLSTNLKLTTLIRLLADNQTTSNPQGGTPGNSTTGIAPTDANVIPLPLDTVPIPLPPTVHPGFPFLGRNTTTPDTNMTFPTTLNRTDNMAPAVAAASLPLVPAPLTMVTNKVQYIPLSFWVTAGNKTFIVLRNENNDYLRCVNGSVSGEYHKGNLTEVPINYLWEPVLFDDYNAHLKTYDGNYLLYNNNTFSCSSLNSPSEYFKVIGGSYSSDRANVMRTDYISFRKDNYYLGVEKGEVQLLDRIYPNTKFVPIFNRTLTDNSTLPSS